MNNYNQNGAGPSLACSQYYHTLLLFCEDDAWLRYGSPVYCSGSWQPRSSPDLTGSCKRSNLLIPLCCCCGGPVTR